LLSAISRRTIGIEKFELTGKPAADTHFVSVADVGRALEAAYDAGLIAGYRIRRAESNAESEWWR
jgi:hypothetical protein